MSAPEAAVVDKVRKLLALAKGNQNEHERDRAMEAAMELLARHNLTVSQITAEDVSSCVQAVSADFNLEVWARAVLSAATRLFYTSYFIQHEVYGWKEVRYPVFVGTAENIAVTIEMAMWLLDSIRRESNRMYKSAGDRRSFRLGAAYKLCERVTAIIQAENAAYQSAPATGGRNSLVVLRTQLERANSEYMQNLNLRRSKGRTVYVKPSAYKDGEAFGAQVELQTGRGVASPKVAGLITQR